MTQAEHGGQPATVLDFGRHAPDDPGPLLPSTRLDTADSGTRHYRHDGWTPQARAAFLDMLARSGVVTDACREVSRSSQAAYALRNRDPLFAAGWDAALSLARTRLADEVFHRSIHGTVDQIWKDGAVVAERHHHDNRLAMAVLNRLDARCDRADVTGAPTRRLTAQWDAYLAALGEDRLADAQALLDPPPRMPAMLGEGSDAMLTRQFHQLGAGRALDEGEGLDDDDEDDERVWVSMGSWCTNYPPPADFDGEEEGAYGTRDYCRDCTPPERAALDQYWPDARTERRETARYRADAKERDAFFAVIADCKPSAAAPAAPELAASADGADCADVIDQGGEAPA